MTTSRTTPDPAWTVSLICASLAYQNKTGANCLKWMVQLAFAQLSYQYRPDNYLEEGEMALNQIVDTLIRKQFLTDMYLLTERGYRFIDKAMEYDPDLCDETVIAAKRILRLTNADGEIIKRVYDTFRRRALTAGLNPEELEILARSYRGKKLRKPLLRQNLSGFRKTIFTP